MAARDWYNNTDTANILGFEPHFGCCTANLHQGWPKLAKAAFAKKGEAELTALVYLPMALHEIGKSIRKVLGIMEYASPKAASLMSP